MMDYGILDKAVCVLSMLYLQNTSAIEKSRLFCNLTNGEELKHHRRPAFNRFQSLGRSRA